MTADVDDLWIKVQWRLWELLRHIADNAAIVRFRLGANLMRLPRFLRDMRVPLPTALALKLEGSNCTRRTARANYLCSLKRPLIRAQVPLRAPVTLCI